MKPAATAAAVLSRAVLLSRRPVHANVASAETMLHSGGVGGGCNNDSQLLPQQQQQQRTFATGVKGARGHGWLKKYRENKGGRHLQGRWHNRDLERLNSINDMVFALNDGLHSSTSSRAYLDVAVGGSNRGRVVIELASAALPTTCTNFVKLCEEGGVVDAGDRKAESWGYRGSSVYKIEKGVGLCMGDVLGQNGEGGRCHPSLWTPQSNHPHCGAYTIADEAHVISHTGPGILSMLNSGVHENDSRFMITTANAPQLDGRFVAFGRVTDGMDLIHDIAQNVFTKRGKPTVDVAVIGCGTL